MRRAFTTWAWPETMMLLRMLVQNKSHNEIAAALGKARNQIDVRVEELIARYPDVMERITGKHISALAVQKPVNIPAVISNRPQKRRLTSGQDGNAGV